MEISTNELKDWKSFSQFYQSNKNCLFLVAIHKSAEIEKGIIGCLGLNIPGYHLNTILENLQLYDEAVEVKVRFLFLLMS